MVIVILSDTSILFSMFYWSTNIPSWHVHFFLKAQTTTTIRINPQTAMPTVIPIITVLFVVLVGVGSSVVISVVGSAGVGILVLMTGIL